MANGIGSFQILSRTRRAVRAAKISESYRAVGSGRARFDAFVDKTDKDDALFSVKFGGGMAVVFPSGGNPMYDVREESHDDTGKTHVKSDVSRGVYMHKDLSSVQPLGSSGGNKNVRARDGSALVIPYGSIAIIGGTGVGKTPLAHALAGHLDDDEQEYALVPFGEPFSGYAVDQEQAAAALGTALLHCSDIVFDSTKDTIGNGSSIKVGFGREILTQMTSWGILGSTCGSSIYVPINPGVGSVADVALIRDMVEGSATASFIGSRDNPGEWVFVIRPGESMQRIVGKLWTARDDEGEMVIDRITFAEGTTAGTDLVTDPPFNMDQLLADRAEIPAEVHVPEMHDVVLTAVNNLFNTLS